ncbi:arginine deiminase family protein [bacterium]|nr:arginine deiminase family protein [bacterium]
MSSLNINNEYGPLTKVILGVANSFGGTPQIDECYDPKSKENVKNGTFPIEKDLIEELNGFVKVLEKYNISVIRPEIIENYNQIFSRDIAFVIENKIIVSGIIHERKKEIDGIKNFFSEIKSENIIKLEKGSRVEGGDVILDDENIYIGYSKEIEFDKYKVARTNEKAIKQIKELFPYKKVYSFELNKSDHNARENALHLDCCFQPIGNKKAIIYEGGFKNTEDILLLIKKFGNENLIRISKEEMYNMNSNVFSISENVIVSEISFKRLNNILRELGFIVEEIKFSEIAKMEGLFRCTTLPLHRL